MIRDDGLIHCPSFQMIPGTIIGAEVVDGKTFIPQNQFDYVYMMNDPNYARVVARLMNLIDEMAKENRSTFFKQLESVTSEMSSKLRKVQIYHEWQSSLMEEILSKQISIPPPIEDSTMNESSSIAPIPKQKKRSYILITHPMEIIQMKNDHVIHDDESSWDAIVTFTYSRSMALKSRGYNSKIDTIEFEFESFNEANFINIISMIANPNEAYVIRAVKYRHRIVYKTSMRDKLMRAIRDYFTKLG